MKCRPAAQVRRSDQACADIDAALELTLHREVKEGTSQTLYPMDPERELENLRRNWATFKRDFKVSREKPDRWPRCCVCPHE